MFDSDLDRMTLEGGDTERRHNTRACVMLSSPDMHMPDTLCRDFDLTVRCGGREKTYNVRDNLRRAYHIPLDGAVEEIRLTVRSNWGGSGETRVFSYDFR